MTGHVALGSSLVLFAIIFLWTPPHFWALALVKSGDYARAGIPMMPNVAGPDATRRADPALYRAAGAASARRCRLCSASAAWSTASSRSSAALGMLGAGRRASIALRRGRAGHAGRQAAVRLLDPLSLPAVRGCCIAGAGLRLVVGAVRQGADEPTPKQHRPAPFSPEEQARRRRRSRWRSRSCSAASCLLLRGHAGRRPARRHEPAPVMTHGAVLHRLDREAAAPLAAAASASPCGWSALVLCRGAALRPVLQGHRLRRHAA